MKGLNEERMGMGEGRLEGPESQSTLSAQEMGFQM